MLGIALALALALILTLAACGGDDSDGSGAASDGGSSAKGTPIKIGNVGSYSGPVSSSLLPLKLGTELWVKVVNDAGGINGHPIELITADDGADAAKGLTAVRKLVEQDKVVAIVGHGSAVEASWGKYVEEKGIPVIGGSPTSVSFITSPMFFPSATTLVPLYYGTLALAKQNGPKFAFLYCVEGVPCKTAAEFSKDIGNQIGVQTVLSTAISASQPDFTAVCQAVKQSGAQSYEVGHASAVLIKVSDACHAQGVDAKIIAVSNTPSSDFLKSPGSNGALIAENNAPFFVDSTPATKEYRDAIAKYQPDWDNAEDTAGASYGWIAGKLFEAAVKASGSDTVTTESVLNGLYSLPAGETLGGLAPPLTFTKGKPAKANCYFVYGIEDGKYTLPQGIKTSCAPDDIVTQILRDYFDVE
ncbi:MAG: ABC transporter substrate-binding protein [Thermoleophilia bacterium]